MNLQEFLATVKGKESDIIEHRGQRALEAVKKGGYSLQYVKEQTPGICLEAVKQDGCSLRYVDKSVFDNTLEEMTVEQICKELGRDIKIVK